jgi:hypothetical protein
MNKQSASVVWLVHSLEVLVLGAVFSLCLSLYQSFNAGTLTLQSAGVAAGSLLFAVIGNGLKGIIGNANFAQAISDLRAELAQQQAAVSPVVIHNNIPASAAPQEVTPPQVSQPVQQFVPPFPYQPSGTFPSVPAVTPGQ